MTTTDYVNVIKALNERFLNASDEGWGFNLRIYGNFKMILFNDEDIWNTHHNQYDFDEADEDWTEESLLKFCEKQYRDYITKLYRTLEL